MRHTPGPWIDCGEGTLLHPVNKREITTRVIEAKGFGRIAEVFDYSNEPGANFQLMLSAPELLAHLKKCVNLLGQYADHDGTCWHGVTNCGECPACTNEQIRTAAREAVWAARGLTQPERKP